VTATKRRGTSSGGRKRKLGWREWVAFPEWGVKGIRTKVDTGARTSALHADDLEELDVDGTKTVRFSLKCEHGRGDRTCWVTVPIVDIRPVRDSGGKEELRPVVLAEVEVRGERWQIEVTLTRRDDMEFNMLLGRRGIAGRFVVDPERSYVGGDPPVRERRGRTRKAQRAPVKSPGTTGAAARKPKGPSRPSSSRAKKKRTTSSTKVASGDTRSTTSKPKARGAEPQKSRSTAPRRRSRK